MFRSFQIIIREFRRSLLKLLHIHDLVRFCKQGVVAEISVNKLYFLSIMSKLLFEQMHT